MSWKVIKIGGSVLYPDFSKGFNFELAKKLKQTVLQFPDSHFSITSGGGTLTRTLFKQVEDAIPNVVDTDLHKLGVASSNVNNELLRIVFGEDAFPRVLRYKEYDEFLEGSTIEGLLQSHIVIAASSKPGFSNDWNALQMAKRLDSKIVINIKNIDGVYSANPEVDPTAELMPKLTWDEYFNIIGNPSEFEPGGNFPIDIKAAKEAKKLGMAFYIIGSTDMNNVKLALEDEEFIGTYIS